MASHYFYFKYMIFFTFYFRYDDSSELLQCKTQWRKQSLRKKKEY